MDFKIVAVNSQGYFENEINRFINSHREKPDVLICTEHKQRDLGAIRDSVQDYTLAAGYPASTGQRGSAVFVKDGLRYQPRRDLDSFSREGTFEAASVEIDSPGANLVVTGLYRSPNSRLSDHNSILDSFANYTSNESNKIHVIGGDINIDLTTNGTTSQILNDHNLRSHIRSATHDSGRCLDNFITSTQSGCSGRRLTSTFSDHRPIQLNVPAVPRTANLGPSLVSQSARRRPRGSSQRGLGRMRNHSRRGSGFVMVRGIERNNSYVSPYFFI